MKELIKKEWLIVKRTPIFMLNIIIANLIFPILLIFSFVIEFSSDMELMPLLSQFIDFSNSGILLIAIGVLLFVCSMSSATSSAISREGSSAWLMKTIPVSLKKQMDSKVCFSMIIDLSILFVIEVFLLLTFKIPGYYLIFIDVPLVLIMLIINYLSLLLDLRKPRLDWKEETEAVKQNFNVFLGMMLTIAMSVLFIVLGVLIIKYNINIYLMFCILSVILLGMYMAMILFIKKNQNRLFSKVG